FMDPNTHLSTAVNGGLPSVDALLGTWPNPVRRAAQLRWSMPRAADVTIDVYDVLGRRVAHQTLGVQGAGMRSAAIGREGLATGMYAYRVRIADPKSGVVRAT